MSKNHDDEVSVAPDGSTEYIQRSVTDGAEHAVTSGEPIPTSEVPVLFGSWLGETRKLQEEAYGHRFDEFNHDKLVDWVKTNVIAAEDELHEALGEISWKPWASSQFFNREAFLGEMVDVLHFVANLVVGAGFTDQQLNEAYREKMNRNRKRQSDGYTGTAKCHYCRRAVDDIEEHGGEVTYNPRNDQYICNSCGVEQ